MRRILAALFIVFSAIVCSADSIYPPPVPVPLGPFSTYTPTAVCSQSTGAAICTATGRYQQTGKRVDLTVTVSISGTFTVGAFTSVSLPVQAVNSIGYWEFSGRENFVTGSTWTGTVAQNATTLVATNSSNSASITTGASISFTGWYETP